MTSTKLNKSITQSHNKVLTQAKKYNKHASELWPKGRLTRATRDRDKYITRATWVAAVGQRVNTLPDIVAHIIRYILEKALISLISKSNNVLSTCCSGIYIYI